MGDEVFSFAISLTPTATEGAGYTDTSQTDGHIKLNVGCIQVVYLHKFFMSLLVSHTHTHPYIIFFIILQNINIVKYSISIQFI